jgi:hypothetical protein
MYMSGRSIFLCLKLHFILEISLWGIGNFTCKLRFEKNLKVVIRSKQWCVGDFSWNLGRRWFLILASEAIWNWPLISLISFCFFHARWLRTEKQSSFGKSRFTALQIVRQAVLARGLHTGVQNIKWHEKEKRQVCWVLICVCGVVCKS